MGMRRIEYLVGAESLWLIRTLEGLAGAHGTVLFAMARNTNRALHWLYVNPHPRTV